MASTPTPTKSLGFRNLTRTSPPEPDARMSPTGEPGSPSSIWFDEPISGAERDEIAHNSTGSPDTRVPIFRHSMFKRAADASPVYKTPPERTSGDYFDLNPTSSEAGNEPGSRVGTPIDLNHEDPREGLHFLKPPPTYRRPSVAQNIRRKTRAMSAAYIEFVNSFKKRHHQSVAAPEPKYEKVIRERGKWYKNWSTRSVILLSAITIAAIFIAVGVSFGVIEKAKSNSIPPTAKWRPAIGTTWQIQLNEPVSNPSYRAYVYDVDFFDNNSTNIDFLHSLGRRVLCHFSAGTYETWQMTDTASFPSAVLGGSVIGWGIERWLDIRQDSVKKIMAERIVKAQKNGCDGIVPDNINGYLSDNGFGLTTSDSIEYVRYLAGLAHNAGLSVGLINAPELISDTLDVIDFGMNEGCAESNTCNLYQPFIQAGKAVFHVEYMGGTITQALNKACDAQGVFAFSLW